MYDGLGLAKIMQVHEFSVRVREAMTYRRHSSI
jgi:hypothetical protein